MYGFLIVLLSILVLLAGAILVMRHLFPLPDHQDRALSSAIAADASTVLGQKMFAGMAEHPGKSGYIPLSGGFDALASRLELARQAQHSIDAQYYIWRGDVSGHLLLKALYDAAQRGVRVRLLLDDNGIVGMDGMLASLNRLENFEVRLFNPSTIRWPKLAGFLFDFFRLNRRMHNKSFMVDGATAIVGGRNIGDEYFQVGDADSFIDLDVLATGPIVADTAASFDHYWNCHSVYPIEQIVRQNGDDRRYRDQLTEISKSPSALKVVKDLKSSAERFRNNEVEPGWGEIQLVVDDPAKGLGRAKNNQLLISQLAGILRQIEREIDLVSPYFVPGREGTKWFSDLARSKKVRILTNALTTTDVLVVHAGYTKYRRKLLEAGVELYELKPRHDKMSGRDELKRIGLSGASLHAKTIAFDDSNIFIGSFNFDPRSKYLNCEMGFLIVAEDLARHVSDDFDETFRKGTYKPILTADDKLAWLERDDEGELLIYQQEPGATLRQQIIIAIVGKLPVEWLL